MSEEQLEHSRVIEDANAGMQASEMQRKLDRVLDAIGRSPVTQRLAIVRDTASDDNPRHCEPCVARAAENTYSMTRVTLTAADREH
jgi:hypothetical protein